MKAEDIAWIGEVTKGLSKPLPSLENYGKNLGTAIMVQRVSRNMTLRELSVLLGFSQSHLSRIERGQRRSSEKLLKKVSHHLEGVISYLEVSRLLDY
jgi:ribosome-binding protein aMBF1 (putative translation factor)